MEVKKLRYPKESFYRAICLIIGGLVWLALLLGTMGTILVFLLIAALVLWFSEKFFQATLFGNAVLVGERQYQQLHSMTNSLSKQLQLPKTPLVFLVNSQGLTNALAVKFLSKRYVILYSDLVDLLWQDSEEKARLKMVVAHELAHHAAGHMSFWLNLIMLPAKFIPFLGAAYSRACEYTADRIAASMVGDKLASQQALMALASGAQQLVHQNDSASFVAQEQQMPGLFAFYLEILSSHPRMTRRIKALDKLFSDRPELSRQLSLSEQVA